MTSKCNCRWVYGPEDDEKSYEGKGQEVSSQEDVILVFNE